MDGNTVGVIWLGLMGEVLSRRLLGAGEDSLGSVVLDWALLANNFRHLPPALAGAGWTSPLTLERIAAPRRQAFVEADLLNAALKDALTRPTQGAVQAARKAADRAQAALERLADNDSHPLVLSVTPRFVPPRRATGDLTVEAPAGTASPISTSGTSSGDGSSSAR